MTTSIDLDSSLLQYLNFYLCHFTDHKKSGTVKMASIYTNKIIIDRNTQREDKIYSGNNLYIESMISASDYTLVGIEKALSLDVEQYKGVICNHATYMSIDGDRTGSDTIIECKGIISVFESNLTQLKYRMEFLRAEPPSVFYSRYDYGYDNVKEWGQTVIDTIQPIKDVSLSEISAMYERCCTCQKDINRQCDQELSELNKIYSNDCLLEYVFTKSLNDINANYPCHTLVDSDVLDRLKKGNRLYAAWSDCENCTDTGYDRDFARRFYKKCSQNEFNEFYAIMMTDKPMRMPKSAAKLFGSNIEAMNKWKYELDRASEAQNQRKFNEQIYEIHSRLRTELQRKSTDFYMKDIYYFIQDIYKGEWSLPKYETMCKKSNAYINKQKR